MGAMCSGGKQQREKKQERVVVMRSEKPPLVTNDVLELWNSLLPIVSRMNDKVPNQKTSQQIKYLLQIKGTTEIMIVNQEKRKNRQSTQDPAYQYIIFQQIDKMGKILGDYLLIDRTFEESHAVLLEDLNTLVNQIEVYGKQFKTKLGKHNLSTNVSHPSSFKPTN